MFKTFDVTVPEFSSQEFDIRDYGGAGDGRTSNTAAFRKAMEAASREGGRVIVPDGIWLTGPIELLSGVELHLADNAVILFDKNPEEYPLIVTDFEGIAHIRARSPIYAEHAENIAITGNGLINGNGHLWRPVKQFKMTERQWGGLLAESPYVIGTKEGGIWFPTESIYETAVNGEIFPGDRETPEEAIAEAMPYYDFYRPVMVSLRYCKGVLLEGVRFQNSPAWNIHPYFCEHLTMRGVTVMNPYYAQNGDGVDVESCRYVHIHHCDFQTGDDAICLKAGKDREARKLKKPCEDVYIHDCKVGMSHGGFVIGSEMSRGVRNVLVKDCTFIDADVGLRFKSAMGRGGVVEDIYMENIMMVRIKNESLVMTMDYVLNTVGGDVPTVQSEDPEDIPVFRNIECRNCICCDPDAYYSLRPLKGHPETISDIRLIDCELGERR